MQDPIVYTGQAIKFTELTKKELINLRKIINRNYESFGCAGKVRNHSVDEIPLIYSEKIVDDLTFNDSETVICANGLGKDGINISLLAQEMGYTPRCFTAYNQYKKGLWLERLTTAKKFYNTNNIEHNLIKTNFFKKQTKIIGFYPYVIGIPIAHNYDSNIILDGIQLHNNKTSIKDESFYCPGETIFTFKNVSKALGIKLSSPLRPLSNFGSQKLLAKRWPEFLSLQRSCMYGNPWCGECTKCNRKALYLETLDINPEKIELTKYVKSKLKLDEYGPVQDSVRQVISKNEGLPYKKWIDGANDYALSHIWEGEKLKKIFSEHFEVYKKDPGLDGEGYTLNPSKWGVWLNN